MAAARTTQPPTTRTPLFVRVGAGGASVQEVVERVHVRARDANEVYRVSRRLESFKNLCHVNHLRVAVLLHDEQVFVASDQQVGSSSLCQRKEVIIGRI